VYPWGLWTAGASGSRPSMLRSRGGGWCSLRRVALMVLDFADGQVVVATCPQLQAEWGLSDRAARCARVGCVRLGGTRRLHAEPSRLAAGPILAGWLSDRYGLTAALAVLPMLCVVSAGMIWSGSRFYERDRAAVPIAASVPAPARPQAGHP
jgi:hypothetical protein